MVRVLIEAVKGTSSLGREVMWREDDPEPPLVPPFLSTPWNVLGISLVIELEKVSSVTFQGI